VGRYAARGLARDVRWSSRYRLGSAFEPGFEIQSALGRTAQSKSFNQQEHYIGPSAYGKLPPGLKYELAWLVGISDAASSSNARLRISYDFPLGD